MSNIVKTSQQDQRTTMVNGKPYTRLTLEDLDNDGVVNLISRIISDASEDYKYAIKHNNKDAMHIMERFFLSDYFSNLTCCAGGDVIRTTKKIAKQEMEEEKKTNKPIPKKHTGRMVLKKDI